MFDLQVQVIQQPYLPQMYSTQGGQLLMPGNIALHPAGMNPGGSIQVIAAGKPFQPNQLASHMITQGKLTQGQPSE